jgi:DNA polymerase-3 subunit epsilon
MMNADLSVLNDLISHVKGLVAQQPLFLDTETTGLGIDDEVCEIGIVNIHGVVLFHTLIKPTKAIPAEAISIHGITNEMVQSAPSFAEILPELDRVLRGRVVMVYNVEYDEKMLSNSARAHLLEDVDFWWSGNIFWHCAMYMYAEYYGDWNDYRGSFRWQILGNAITQCGLTAKDRLHGALADADATRQIVLHMANTKVEKPVDMEEVLNEEEQ